MEPDVIRGTSIVAKQEEYAGSETSDYCSLYEDHGSPSERRADNERPLDAAFECMNMNNSSSTKPVEATGDFPHPDNPYRKEGAMVRNQTDPPLLQVEGSERARNNHPNVSTRNNPNARELVREANIKVYVDDCKHLLADVLYNDREDFSDALDNNHTGKNTMDLIKSLLTNEEVRHIWSECNGGSDPPMNLLFHLAGMNCNLAQLREYAFLDNRGRFFDLITLITDHEESGETRLDQLHFNLLDKISKLIRVQPFPTEQQAKPRWKTLAGLAELDDITINSLDVTENRKSLAMVFIQYISQTYPDQNVAWLAKGLKDIGINNMLKNKSLKIFKKCKKKGCIVTC